MPDIVRLRLQTVDRRWHLPRQYLRRAGGCESLRRPCADTTAYPDDPGSGSSSAAENHDIQHIGAWLRVCIVYFALLLPASFSRRSDAIRSPSSFGASIVRIVYIKIMKNNPDTTWTQGWLPSGPRWRSTSPSCDNCLVLLRPFVRRYMPWLVSRGSQRGQQKKPRLYVASRSIRGHRF